MRCLRASASVAFRVGGGFFGELVGRAGDGRGVEDDFLRGLGGGCSY
jgi:hypothetical protein